MDKTKLKLTSFWPFGKYKGTGKTIGDVARTEPSYVLYMIKVNNEGYYFSKNVKETAETYEREV